MLALWTTTTRRSAPGWTSPPSICARGTLLCARCVLRPRPLTASQYVARSSRTHQTLWQIDFFDLEETLYHVICLSLVVNFVGDPARRGEMLAKAVRMLHPRGALVFVLPLACVDNSRYMTRERLHSILQQLQLSILETHATAKLYFLLAQRTDAPAPATETEVGLKGAFPKVHLRHGDKRNNFHIVF
jgi:hypothetical protein